MNKENLTLANAKINDCFLVQGFTQCNIQYRRRLLAMGIIPGSKIVLKNRAPLGCPLQIEVKGFQLFLRKSEATILLLHEVCDA